MTADIHIVPTAALTTTTIALVAFVLRYPTAALWAVVVALVLALGGLFTLAAETIDLRGDLDDAERKMQALEDECQRLHLLLTETQIAGGKVLPFPAVRGVVPVADEPIPIHDRVLIDHWIEDVQNWGEDAES